MDKSYTLGIFRTFLLARISALSSGFHLEVLE